MDTRDDRSEFDVLARSLRPEIRLHCYRMLGSVHDADDAVQEALLRAWRGRAGLRDRSAARAWLYRIATNACLRAMSKRGKGPRVLSESRPSAALFEPLGAPDRETPWLEPCPDTWLADLPDRDPGPEARYDAHETIRLAFLAAIQQLPPRQRAVLLLRDVVGMSAIETAAILETSVAAVNSALQRARSALEAGREDGRRDLVGDPDAAAGRLLDRYVRAWEAADLDGLVGILRDDARWTMPPWPEWYVGARTIVEFLGWVWRPGRDVHERLLPISANGQPAFGYYRSGPGEPDCRPFAIQLVDIDGDRIGAIANFVDAGLFATFDLPELVPVADRPMSSEDRLDQMVR